MAHQHSAPKTQAAPGGADTSSWPPRESPKPAREPKTLLGTHNQPASAHADELESSASAPSHAPEYRYIPTRALQGATHPARSARSPRAA